jgi:hypothetical protein
MGKAEVFSVYQSFLPAPSCTSPSGGDPQSPEDKVSNPVNEPLAGDNLSRVNLSFERGRPLGDDAWTARWQQKLGVQYTLSPADGRN